jgi:hypothetical protein
MSEKMMSYEQALERIKKITSYKQAIDVALKMVDLADKSLSDKLIRHVPAGAVDGFAACTALLAAAAEIAIWHQQDRKKFLDMARTAFYAETRSVKRAEKERAKSSALNGILAAEMAQIAGHPVETAKKH